MRTSLNLILGLISMEKNMEIYREDGKNFRSIRSDFKDDGRLVISGHDMGPITEEFWGKDEYEYFMIIPKESVELFTLNLLKHVFNNDKRVNWTDVRNILEKNNIDYHFDYWM